MKDAISSYSEKTADRGGMGYEETRAVTVEIELTETTSSNSCVFGWVPEGSFLSISETRLGCAHPSKRGFCSHQTCQHDCPFFCLAMRSLSVM